MKKNSFFQELKRRNVYKVAVAYGITAWLLAQIASLAANTFDAPSWIMQMILILLIIGLPIAVLLAWAYEMTPEGIVRTEDLDLEKEEVDGRKSKRPIVNNVVIGVLLALLVGQFIYNRFKAQSGTYLSAVTNQELSIAVLPFINLNSKDENLEYFSDGVTQEITDELGKIKSFIIPAFTTSYQYKNHTKSYINIATELGVNFLISGSSRIFGDSIRLSLELFNPHTNQRVWNGAFNEAMESSSSIQLAIARQVAKSLNTKLTENEERSLDIEKVPNGEAFNLFLKAKVKFSSLTREGFEESIKLLKKALDIDPDYSKAHTLLAWVYDIQSTSWLGGTLSTDEAMGLIQPHIEKSIALDPNSSDVYLVRANTNLYFKGLLREAEKDVDYALSLNSWPRVSTSACMCTIISVYTALGKVDKAKEAARRGREIDPDNVFVFWDLANIHMIEGDVKRAQTLYEEGLRAYDIPLFQFFVGWSYYHGNQFEKSLGYLEKAYEDDPFGFVLAYLSNGHFAMNHIEESKRYSKYLEQRIAKGEPNLNLAMAMTTIAQGSIEETLTWLERAQQENDYAFSYLVNVDPIFKPLYNEERFIELRRKMQYFSSLNQQ